MVRIADTLTADRFVDDALRRAARDEGDRPAYIDVSDPGSGPVVTTYADWDRAADGFSAWLAEREVGRGAVVAMRLPNHEA